MRKQKRVILSAGGTGGHLFPAQSLAESLSGWEILFAAGGLSHNRYFDRSRFPFQEISCATFSLSQPLRMLKGCATICSGVKQSRALLKNFAPDLVVGFGSFFTLPLLIAAVMEKVPIVLHEQNAVAGKVNRLLAPFARKYCITFPTPDKGSKKRVEVAFPLRHTEKAAKEEALRYFGLTSPLPTLLVFGGSQGAVRLNTLFLEAAPFLPPVQILHFTGNEKRAEEASQHYAELGVNACVKAFEPRMDLAMSAADCAVTRAGAATICELIAFTLPALLVPYPFAAEHHQEKNGQHFISIVKGGRMYKENEINAATLAVEITKQLACVAEARQNITLYKEQHVAPKLSELIEEMVRDGS